MKFTASPDPATSRRAHRGQFLDLEGCSRRQQQRVSTFCFVHYGAQVRPGGNSNLLSRRRRSVLSCVVAGPGRLRWAVLGAELRHITLSAVSVFSSWNRTRPPCLQHPNKITRQSAWESEIQRRREENSVRCRVTMKSSCSHALGTIRLYSAFTERASIRRLRKECP